MTGYGELSDAHIAAMSPAERKDLIQRLQLLVLGALGFRRPQVWLDTTHRANSQRVARERWIAEHPQSHEALKPF
jgi:hypothetical protein